MKKLIALFSLLLSTGALATGWTASNLRIVDAFAIPAYQKFVDTSNVFNTRTMALCTAPDPQKLEAVRHDFHAVMDAWQHVQILRQGPVELYMRHFRVQMWPDRHNTGAKQLRRLKSVADPAVLEPQAFTAGSVAVQGIPTMERLLFSNGITVEGFTENGRANYSCSIMQAISLNLHSIANELLNEWQGEYRSAIATPSANNDYFATGEEAAAQFLKQLYTELQAVTEQKLMRPLDGEHFRPRRAESWRSGRSLRNILLNLESAQQLYSVGFAPSVADEKLKRQLQAQFKLVIEQAEELQMPLLRAYEKQPQALARLQKEISTLKRMLGVELPLAVNLPLGFNSLDGD